MPITPGSTRATKQEGATFCQYTQMQKATIKGNGLILSKIPTNADSASSISILRMSINDRRHVLIPKIQE